MLKLAVIGTSRKENEHRLPIHPLHFDQIPAEVRPTWSALRVETTPRRGRFFLPTIVTQGGIVAG